MRPRKFLLITKALTTAGFAVACGKESAPPLPGNPKGTWAVEQDGGAKANDTPPPSADPVPTAPIVPTAPTNIPPPGNPKGSHYNHPPPTANPPPTVILPPANPKGSHYDAGMKKP